MDGSSINQGIDVSSGTTAGVHTARAQVEAARIRRRELIAAGRLSAEEPPLTLPDNVFRGYTVQGEIHRGGQGVVYQALQQSTNRKVAIKVLLDGAHASKSSRLRFEREIELVAGLRHPNVISIFHSDLTADGLRYCVMDYVRGLPITRYVRQHDQALPEVLRLFMQICDAINHAHQRGVIHRDLKPSNILVDDEGVPRVLDFGLAKGLGEANESLVSMTGQVVGTLPYMSPEQTRGDADEIDIRTDVYALGVLLYELLTGHYPYPVSGPMADVLNHILESEPVPPSRYGWAGTSTAPSQRSADLDDDLETIVLKALAKDRARRYQSAGELSRDIGHYLADEPIESKRDSFAYVLRKQLHRHRVAAAVGISFVLLIAAGLVVAGTLWRQAAHARDAESDQRARAEAINTFLKDMLTAADPAKAKGAMLTVREALDTAAKRVEEGSFKDQPLVEADIRFTIGSTYLALGLFPEAETQLQAANALQTRVLGQEHPYTLRTRTKLAETLWYKCDYAGVAAISEPTFEAQRRVLGADDPETLKSTVLLGRVLWLKPGRFDEAVALLRSAIDRLERVRGHDHEDTAAALDGLGEAYSYNAYHEKAEPLHREALRINTKCLGEEHPNTLYSMFFLAHTLDPQSREAMHRRVYALRLRVLGPDHVDTLASQQSVAQAVLAQSRFAEAEPLLRESLAAQLRIAPDYINTIHAYHFLGWCLEQQKKYAEAEVMVRRGLEAALKQFGPEDPDTTIRMKCKLAQLLANVSKDAEAEQVARDVLAIQRRQTPRPPPEELTQSSIALVKVLHRRGADAEATQIERELIDFWLAEAHAPDAGASVLNGAARRLLHPRMEALRDPSQAVQLALQANQRSGGQKPQFLRTLAEAYMHTGDVSKAGKTFEEALRLMENKESRAELLNAAAWSMLTEVPEAHRDLKAALDFALRCNAFSENRNSGHLDTLALAYFRLGDAANAVRSQQAALELLPADATGRAEYEARLAEYESASGVDHAEGRK